MKLRLSIGSFAVLVLAVCLLVADPVHGQGTSPASGPATAPSTQMTGESLKDAADAAWSVLETLRDHVHAAGILDDPARRATALADAKKRLGELTVLRAGSEPETLSTYISLWPTVVGHYVDGFARDRLTVVRAGQGQQVIARIDAANPKDQKIYDELFAQITKSLEQQGVTGNDLTSRRQVLLVRELAQRGVGYPITATIVLGLRNVNGQWKVAELDLRPPPGQAATQPTIRVQRVPGGAATQPVR